MTFCLGMKVQEGLVAIADTRITTGAEATLARKVSIQQHGHHSLFLLTSGLRSVSDKALTYFEEILERGDAAFDRLYKAVNVFADQVRRVADEDKEALAEARVDFNLHCLVGGQFEKDREHKLYLLYPQSNWVEVSEGTPYFLIGQSAYGKPLLDRALRFDSSLDDALKIGYLAFDATRTSATDVGFPIDVVIYRRDAYEMDEHRYKASELAEISDSWHRGLRNLIDGLPSGWVRAALPEQPAPTVRPITRPSQDTLS